MITLVLLSTTVLYVVVAVISFTINSNNASYKTAMTLLAALSAGTKTYFSCNNLRDSKCFLALRWRFTRAVRVHIEREIACPVGDKITRQRYTPRDSYVVYALETYYGVRGRMEKPYPQTLSAGCAVSFSTTGVRTRFKSVNILMSKL